MSLGWIAYALAKFSVPYAAAAAQVAVPLSIIASGWIAMSAVLACVHWLQVPMKRPYRRLTLALTCLEGMMSTGWVAYQGYADTPYSAVVPDAPPVGFGPDPHVAREAVMAEQDTARRHFFEGDSVGMQAP